MNAKCIGIFLAVFLFILCISTIGYSAVVASNATVISAGPYGFGTKAITVFSLRIGTDPTAKYFKAPSGREKEMLAVAIAAITNTRKIKVYKNSNSLGGSTPATATLLFGMELK